MSSDPLDLETLVRQARDATGLEDLGGTSWREGLERLLAALRAEARLNAIGLFKPPYGKRFERLVGFLLR